MLNEGDSGGPFYTIKNNQHYLVGIISYGPSLCNKGIGFDKLCLLISN